MTPIKTVTDLLSRHSIRVQLVALSMIIPWFVYFILDSFTDMWYIYRAVISFASFMLLHQIIVAVTKRRLKLDLIAFNKRRDEENHEFITMILDGKLYTDNHIMDAIEALVKEKQKRETNGQD